MSSSKSDVGRKVWNSIARLGVVSGLDEESSVKLIDELELRDKVAQKEIRCL